MTVTSDQIQQRKLMADIRFELRKLHKLLETMCAVLEEVRNHLTSGDP